MRRYDCRFAWKPFVIAMAAVLFLAGPAWAQADRSASEESKGSPVVRTFGAQGGYRTEVTSETRGTLNEEDRRQIALLTAQVFQHIDQARRALDADDAREARQEVDKGRKAIQAIRAIQPRTTVHTLTKAPDGHVVYEDSREVQEDRVPLFEGMLHARSLAPILAAKRNAVEVTGVRLVESESVTTEVLADLEFVEGQLGKAARALDDHKADAASRALFEAQVRGVDFRYSKEDTPLAEARDAIWLARRSLEENNAAQAQINLGVARQRLQIYRQVAPQDRHEDVDRMLNEVQQLENQLRQETAQHPASRADRTRQGNVMTRWWEQVNGWFKRHF